MRYCRTAVYLLLVLLGLLGRRSGAAQEAGYLNLDYERLSSELGLSQNMIHCLLQDRQGFIWVGTKDGLNRFDGYRFVTYRNDPFDSLSISGNIVHHILEDRAGRMWIVTDQGINLFDREKEVFYLLKQPYSTFELREDPQGNLWQGNAAGLLCISLPAQARSLERVKATLSPIAGLKGMGMNIPVWDAAGRAWVGKFDQEIWSLRLDSTSGAARLDRDFSDVPDPRFREFLTTTDSAAHRFHNWLAPGRDGKIWMSNSTFLHAWDAKTGRFVSIPIPQEIVQPNVASVHSWNHLANIVEDRRNRLWLGGFGGAFRVDLAEKKVLPLLPDSVTGDHPLFYGVGAIWEDAGGLIWLGTRGNGLLKFNENARRFAPGLWQGESVRALYKTSDGRVWVGTNVGGIYWLDPKTGQLQPIVQQGSLFRKDKGVSTSFLQDRNGALWVTAGDWGLLKITNWQSGSPRLEVARPAAPLPWTLFSAPRKIVEDPGTGVLWVASQDDLRCFDPQSGAVESFPFFDHDFARNDRNLFPTLFLDRRGRLWCGTSEGLFRFDIGKKTFEKFQNDRKKPTGISNNLVKCITEDPAQPERYLWIGTGGGGLNRFDTETGAFEKFTEKDGLPDLVVYGILADDKGRLWMSTNKGLSVFDPHARTFRNFDQHDGLQNLEFNTCAYHKAADGQMFFGGIEGFNAFYPEQMLQANTHVPNIVFTDFKISNRSVSHKDPHAPLTTAIAYARKIVLPHDVKVISFEFAALDFSAPSKNRFACKMEGFDPDWQQLGPVHSATYTNLGPGTYTFRVRGSNNDGVWNEAGAHIEIEILSPWWATWWACFAYLLLAGGILLTLYRLQANRNQAKAETARLRDLNEAKSQFISTVSHELRTPLTSVMGFAKIIKKRLEERILPHTDLSDPKTKRATEQVIGNLDIVISESERLTALINDVLDLAKIESGKAVWQEERLQLDSLIERAIAATITLFEQKNLALRSQVEPVLPGTLGDPDRLLQVLVNLLSNAAKFTEQGVVTVTARRQDDRTLLLGVADTGIGIPEEARELVFEKFRQVTGDTLTDKPQGTGLGLPICREIVEHHGGRIWVESETGKGSTFWFTLPVR